MGRSAGASLAFADLGGIFGFWARHEDDEVSSEEFLGFCTEWNEREESEKVLAGKFWALLYPTVPTLELSSEALALAKRAHVSLFWCESLYGLVPKAQQAHWCKAQIKSDNGRSYAVRWLCLIFQV